jgi:hypothetical protein
MTGMRYLVCLTPSLAAALNPETAVFALGMPVDGRAS